MSSPGETTNQSSTVILAGEMTIHRVSELRQTLIAALETSRVLEVELSRVSELDTAGAQLLMFVRRTAERKAKQVRLLSPSQAVFEVWELLNLTRTLAPELRVGPVRGESTR